MARTTIFQTQEILYDFLFMDMVPAASIIPAPFALEPGQTYAVQWGENLFENLSVIDLADAGFTGGAIGNGSGFELPGNDEPFAIAYFTDDTGGEIVVFFLDGNVSQTITVYQESAESPIMLKDRTGTDIEYEGVEGVRVFDKAGNAHVFVPPVEREEKTVELDFSGGAMEVTPTAGKVLSKVDIPVPENLLPENIAKDVDIAGVVGTHEGGGGGGGGLMAPYTFMAIGVYARGFYQTGTEVNGGSVSVSIPKEATILGRLIGEKGGYSSSSVAGAQINETSSTINNTTIQPTITESGNNLTVTYANSKVYVGGSSSYRKVTCLMLTVFFTLPGIYMRGNDVGTLDIYADATATKMPENNSIMYGIECIDLSESRIESIPQRMIYFRPCKVIKLPSTLKSIGSYGLYANNCELYDFSLCESVPTLGGSYLYKSSNTQILVPAALYNEWIAAANWSSYASYIVPV